MGELENSCSQVKSPGELDTLVAVFLEMLTVRRLGFVASFWPIELGAI